MLEFICKEDTYPFGNQLLNQSGIYVDTFKSVNNCDSIVRLDLRILGRDADTVRAQIFEGEVYNVDRFKFKKEGDYPLSTNSNFSSGM